MGQIQQTTHRVGHGMNGTEAGIGKPDRLERTQHQLKHDLNSSRRCDGTFNGLIDQVDRSQRMDISQGRMWVLIHRPQWHGSGRPWQYRRLNRDPSTSAVWDRSGQTGTTFADNGPFNIATGVLDNCKLGNIGR